MMRVRGWEPAILFSLCIARLWLMPLPSSFWVDEMGTAFVVQHPGHPSLAVAPQVPASIYYWFPAISQRLFGLSEVGYRLPSVLFMALALLLISRIAARLIDPRAAWFAAFACLALRGIDYEAANARPYALGICCAAAALWCLVRWLDTGAWTFAAPFIVFAALLWRVHLIYWPFYLLIALYAMWRLAGGDSRAGWGQVAIVSGALTVALVPVAFQAMQLMREAGSHVIVPVPGLHTFEHALRWNVPLVCGASGSLLARMLRWRTKPLPLSGATLALILGWWLIQPTSLFVFSWVTGNSVFLSRYLSLALPGIALTATAAAFHFFPAERWRIATLGMGIGALMFMGQWRQVWPEHHPSGWRSAAQLVNSVAPGPEIPVICPSPFIEARPPAWSPEYRLPGFLYAHLPVYPLSGRLILFPFETSPEAERYAANITRETLQPAGRFVLYGGAGSIRYWRKWFATRPELAAWHNRLTEFGDVFVAIFDIAIFER